MVDRSSDSRVLAQESGLRAGLTLISGTGCSPWIQKLVWPLQKRVIFSAPMVDRNSDSRVLAQESGLRAGLTLISGSRVFALDPEISVARAEQETVDDAIRVAQRFGIRLPTE